MSEVITPDKFPSNGGWKYRQPQFGNWTNNMAMVGFKASVDEIRQARLKNKALSAKHNLSTDEEVIAQELLAYNRKIRGIAETPSFFQPRRNPLAVEGSGVAAEANWFRQIIRSKTGVVTLADWLGRDGNPVDQGLANQRADVCAGKNGDRCPQNRDGDLLTFFTRPVTNLIRKQLEERKQLSLSTNRDSEIGVCFACGCPLKLKVHVPIKFIKAHIQEPELKSLDPRCWMLSEK